MLVGFDVGGTFTDVVVLSANGDIRVTKVLSLLDVIGAQISALVQPWRPRACKVLSMARRWRRAVIEGKTAVTGFITTKGFRDDLEMRGQKRPAIYDSNWDRLPPLVPRYRRLEVDERTLGSGAIDRPLDLTQAAKVIRALVEDEKVEAIAICLINSYLNPSHEKQLCKLASEVAPQVVVCSSSEIHPEIREYERASTTVINASLMPVINRYLENLEKQLSSFRASVLIMQSNGGVMSTAAARRRPVYMIESGPAAGALGAAKLAAEKGMEKVISFDMGGTTAKVCLIEGGQLTEKTIGEVGGQGNMSTFQFSKGGHALMVPSIDLIEVGAGGGSIAWIGPNGTLRVGPQSAGAQPGPACYARGGQAPTVTDANLVLGYINPDSLAGGNLRLDFKAGWDAIESQLALPLGMDVLSAAYGVVQVANSTMMRAVRAVSIERGRDPRQFTLLAFGGSGPIHAAALAEEIGITKVIVPIFPGLFSALGLLLAPYRQDYVASVALPLDNVTAGRIVEMGGALKSKALGEMTADGVQSSKLRFEHQAELKYNYQLQGLTVSIPHVGKLSDLLPAMHDTFRNSHHRLFGYTPDEPVELVNLRLKVTAARGESSFRELASQVPSQRPVPAGTMRDAYFGPKHGVIGTPVLNRSDVQSRVAGPIIVQEMDSTVVVRPNWQVERDEQHNLCLTRVNP